MENTMTVLQYEPVYKKNLTQRRSFWVACGIVLFLLIVLIPSLCWAFDYPFDILKPIECVCATINGFLVETINSCFYNAVMQVKNVGTDGLLTSDWSNLFGGANDIHAVLIGISNTAVKPVAGAIMSCVFLMQFIKIAGKAESTGTLPMVKDVIYLFLLLAFFTALVTHADDICGALYATINQISKAIAQGTVIQLDPTTDFINNIVDGSEGGPSLWSGAEGRDAMAAASFGNVLILSLCLIFCFLFGMAASICVTFMVFARALQLYLYSMFSPIPFSVLGFEQTRQWGIGFFKNFLAIALSGTIILVILFLFPHIVSSVLGGVDISQPVLLIGQLNADADWGALGNVWVTVGKLFACFIILIVATVKSGSYARDILGG